MVSRVITGLEALPQDSLELAIHRAIELSLQVQRFDRFRTTDDDASLFQYWMIPLNKPEYGLDKLNKLLLLPFDGTEFPGHSINLLELYQGKAKLFTLIKKKPKNEDVVNFGYIDFPTLLQEEKESTSTYSEDMDTVHFYDIKQFPKHGDGKILDLDDANFSDGAKNQGVKVRLFPDRSLARKFREILLAGDDPDYAIPAKYLNNHIK